jgi:hypothetical protein
MSDPLTDRPRKNTSGHPTRIKEIATACDKLTRWSVGIGRQEKNGLDTPISSQKTMSHMPEDIEANPLGLG